MVSTRSGSRTPGPESSALPAPSFTPTKPPASPSPSGSELKVPSTPSNGHAHSNGNGNGNGNGRVEMTTTLSRTEATSIATPAGNVTVRPYRSSSNAALKAVLSFTPRTSALDRQNSQSQVDTFRGFFTLFWIGLALLFLRTSLESWETNKTPLSWTFGRLITGDVLVLALSDLLMVLSMFLCVPFVKAFQYGYIRYHWTGVVLQHLFQASYLGVAVLWGYVRDWYWVQSGFLVLHALSNMMKMHSYIAHNGMLSTVSLRLSHERKLLDEHAAAYPGGREAALADAARRQEELEAREARETVTPIGTPMPGTPLPGSTALTGTLTPGTASGMTGYDAPEGAIRHLAHANGSATGSGGPGILDGAAPISSGPSTPSSSLGRRSGTGAASTSALAASAELRHRAGSNRRQPRHPATASIPEPEKDLPAGTSLEPSALSTPHQPRPLHPLAWSSDERIAVLARNIGAMEEELRSNGAKGLVWPQNVTYRHFADFMIIPTLVYQLEYPRTSTMDPLVVIEKIIATFGTFSLIYTITEHYIMPFLPKPEDSLFKSFVNLALPMMVNYLLIFYIIFECVCSGFAELSYFADREFYQDWWNSTTWDQFSRKWNKPVHTFLLRHVYASSMDGLQLSRMSAAFVTFLLSALCHELVMAVVSKKLRPYLFMMQMAQLPLIALGKVPIVRRNKTIGNIVFWLGLMCGFPLLAIGYLKY